MTDIKMKVMILTGQITRHEFEGHEVTGHETSSEAANVLGG